MALTAAQKHLITELHILGVEKDAIIGIVSAKRETRNTEG